MNYKNKVKVESRQPVEINNVTYWRELGKIKYTRLGSSNHGIFTFLLDFSFNGMGQGFGTFCLDKYNESLQEREGTAFGCDVIMNLIKFFKVESWEDIKGKEAYVLRGDKGFGGTIRGLQDKFNPENIFLMSDYIEKWGLK